MFGFLKKILRNIRALNCSSRPTLHDGHDQPPVTVLDRRKDILVTKENENSTRRQTFGTDTLDKSVEAAQNLVICPSWDLQSSG
jgi:hypothetical protein